MNHGSYHCIGIPLVRVLEWESRRKRCGLNSLGTSMAGILDVPTELLDLIVAYLDTPTAEQREAM
jgi:hypothetical protein